MISCLVFRRACLVLCREGLRPAEGGSAARAPSSGPGQRCEGTVGAGRMEWPQLEGNRKDRRVLVLALHT